MPLKLGVVEPTSKTGMQMDELPFDLAKFPALKAVAHIYAPAVMWKSQAADIAAFIYLCGRCLNRLTCLLNGNMGGLLFLPKRGKSCASVANLCAWELQGHVGTSIVKLLTWKARIQCMSVLCIIPQFAYISNRSTVEALLQAEPH